MPASAELIALDWRDVDICAGTVQIRHTYNPIDGLTAPKDHDVRTVYLTPEAEQVFGDWLAEVGAAPETGIIFPAPRSRGYIDLHYLRRIVTEAMKAAGIPQVDVHSGRSRKIAFDESFHVDPHEHDDHADSFFVLDGEVEFTVGDEVVRAGPGTWLSAPPGARHGFRNGGSGRSRVLNVHAPDAGFADRIRGL